MMTEEPAARVISLVVSATLFAPNIPMGGTIEFIGAPWRAS